ncbi:MAG TPA: hypothetical protein VKE74_17065 [Gemmataceae bacterium]|nr:hypothetical protein [Gemmataceae bacterium]
MSVALSISFATQVKHDVGVDETQIAAAVAKKLAGVLDPLAQPPRSDAKN